MRQERVCSPSFLMFNNVGDDQDDDEDDDDEEEVDDSSTRSPSSSCSSAQAPPDGSRGHECASTTPTRFLTSKY